MAETLTVEQGLSKAFVHMATAGVARLASANERVAP
jgi:hypothetical protein